MSSLIVGKCQEVLEETLHIREFSLMIQWMGVLIGIPMTCLLNLLFSWSNGCSLSRDGKSSGGWYGLTVEGLFLFRLSTWC